MPSHNVFTMPGGSWLSAFQQRRPHSASYMECARSIWHLHDETINIWTHLVACAVFSAVTIRAAIPHTKRRAGKTCANSFYLPAATLVFLCSTLYHTFANHEKAMVWRSLNHCSITAFIWASSRSLTRLAFDHKRAAARLYSVALTAAALGLMFWNLFGTAAWNGHTQVGHISHVGYGAFAALPALSRPPNLRWRATRGRQRVLRRFRALVLISGIGGVLYSTRLMERMTDARAGWRHIDHHAMHMAVVIGACIYGREVLYDEYA
jgi:adiponectin receptor